jgi:hypothetical protein
MGFCFGRGIEYEMLLILYLSLEMVN